MQKSQLFLHQLKYECPNHGGRASWISITKSSGMPKRGWQRGRLVQLSNQTLRVTLCLLHSSWENTSSICRKRITSTGYRPGSTCPSGSTSPRHVPESSLCYHMDTHRGAVRSPEDTSKNALVWDDGSMCLSPLLPHQVPCLRSLFNPDSANSSRLPHHAPFLKILYNKIELDA